LNPATVPASALERLIRRDRLLVAVGLSSVAVLAWWALWRMAADMGSMSAGAMGMPEMRGWGLADLAWLFMMWAVMMVAMMLPSAAPLMLLVVGTYRRRGSGARWLTTAFAGGYVASWTAFSVVAALTQLIFHRAALLSPAMASRSATLGGVILVSAGVYQWLPIKNACLTHCRSPLHFLSHEWREGSSGAFGMGFRHGLFCVGCCWAVMALLFVAGVMNLLWVATIAGFVLVEKLTPRGVLVGRVVGAACVAWGAYVLFRGA
jgi:predicted metal-binding membrane protein